ncbi:MAG: beta-galactosidase [Candidatus Aenigmarchaeota archaeon]|nr:beta-galactosidase [Candidatus Aenigmarchaeota archaeon]
MAMKNLFLLLLALALVPFSYAQVPEGFASPGFSLPAEITLAGPQLALQFSVNHEIVWGTVYYLSNRTWKPAPLLGTQPAERWVKGLLTANVQIPASDLLREQNLVLLVYGCDRSSSQGWSCSSADGENAWEIAFSRNLDYIQRDIIFFKAHRNEMLRDPTYLSDHELIDAVFMQVNWPTVEPERGRFDFAELDSLIDAWHNAGKKILLRVNPYGQARGNDETPQWLLDSVPVIEFDDALRGHVVIPKVWDQSFTREYKIFVEYLAQKYDNDPRVQYVQIGIGHIGFTTAQPSKEGDGAFLSAGWTLEIWENYVKNIIDVYSENFKEKKLMIGLEPIFIRSYLLRDNLDTGKRIGAYTARKNIIISSNGLEPGIQDFENTAIPEIIRYLVSLNLPDLHIALGDDWPLYGQTGTVYRDEYAFQSALNNILNLWEENGRRYTPYLVLLRDDLQASQPGDRDYNQVVYDATANFVNHVR